MLAIGLGGTGLDAGMFGSGVAAEPAAPAHVPGASPEPPPTEAPPITPQSSPAPETRGPIRQPSALRRSTLPRASAFPVVPAIRGRDRLRARHKTRKRNVSVGSGRVEQRRTGTVDGPSAAGEYARGLVRDTVSLPGGR